jgi:hypothetical protein
VMVTLGLTQIFSKNQVVDFIESLGWLQKKGQNQGTVAVLLSP